jgi:hypothetical protein
MEMIDLNPLVIERSPCKPPANATPEEMHAAWYSITDSITYLPGLSGKVTFCGCFHDLPDGLQTHIFAPMGVEIRSRWIVGGSLPGEPAAPVELGLGIPRVGLYLREDVDLRCNFLTTPFVKKTLVKSHSMLVDKMVEKAKNESVDQADADLIASQRQEAPLLYNTAGQSSSHAPRGQITELPA